MNCHYCGASVIWGSDYDLEDMTGEPGIFTTMTCSGCGAEYEITLREGVENEYND